MAKPYSLDLRKRVIDRVERGQSCRAAANELDVSASFSVKLKSRQAWTGSIEPSTMGRPVGTGKLAAFRDFLIAEVEARPDITMPELAAKLLDVHGITADPATLSRFLCRAGYTFKKNSAGIRARTPRCPPSTSQLDK